MWQEMFEKCAGWKGRYIDDDPFLVNPIDRPVEIIGGEFVDWNGTEAVQFRFRFLDGENVGDESELAINRGYIGVRSENGGLCIGATVPHITEKLVITEN